LPAIRPLLAGDAAAADLVAGVALDRPSTAWHRARIAHLAAADPGGAWIAVDDDDRPVGLALALVRGRVWGLSLLAVADAARRAGVGRELLRRAHAYGADRGAEGWIVLSSGHPAALRSYAGLGLDLHPVVDAAGIPDLSAAPGAAARVQEGDPALADAIARELRGAGHGPDLGLLLAKGGRLLAFEDRAFALVHPDAGIVSTVGARDEQAAAAVLWAALAALPRGATAHVEFLTARQQWAVRTVLAARLALTPGGAVFTAGRLGPMAPYLPNGAFL
jgi:GNAT superfamily N-acetyltransferase